jgi:hypothetical protein
VGHHGYAINEQDTIAIDHPWFQVAEVRITLNVAERHGMTPGRVSACSIAALAAICALGHRQTAAVMQTSDSDEFVRKGDAVVLEALAGCEYTGNPDADAMCAAMPELQLSGTGQ